MAKDDYNEYRAGGGRDMTREQFYSHSVDPKKKSKHKALKKKTRDMAGRSMPKKTCGHSDMAQTSSGCLECEKSRRIR